MSVFNSQPNNIFFLENDDGFDFDVFYFYHHANDLTMSLFCRHLYNAT